ncbi:MAG: hypothetical protein LBK83_01300 [Treponema sp.]|jgi:hypothetical protein|nr:hypothetical protein [Treponema sp.]
MPKEFRPGWNYFYSDVLQQEIAVHIKTGEVYCEDRTVYKPEEIAIMQAANQEASPGVHLVKKVFKGTITNFIGKENRKERRPNGPGKPQGGIPGVQGHEG